MVPESLPLIVGLIGAVLAFRYTHAERKPYQRGFGRELLISFAVFLVVFTLLKAIFFLNMEQLLTVTLGGAFGGFMLGALIAGSNYLDGSSPSDCWAICWVTTGVFTFMALIGGVIIII